MRDHPLKFGFELARLRRDAGLTKAEFARRLNISIGALWKYEHGWVRPDRPRVIEMARALDIDSLELQRIFDLADGLEAA